MFRHTKIIATVGPASQSEAMIQALIAAGTDIVRLNFSHGTHESHGTTLARVRAAAARAQREVAVLQDLGGPKIRTGRLEGGRPIELSAGEALTIATGDFVGGRGRIAVAYSELARSVRQGDRLLVADGTIELRVDASDGREIQTVVVDGGTLGEHKGLNAPGVMLPASAITPKDVEDLAFGLSIGVDMVALSFVQSGADLRRARELMAERGGAGVPLVAKLERPQALECLDEILDLSDAVMVARGDLGLEMPLERVPRAQKAITFGARRRGIPVIVATQVLESMTTEARPTRAEVSDAAHAVDTGVDAIMLAGETAVGAFPARAVQTLDAIIRDAESGFFSRTWGPPSGGPGPGTWRPPSGGPGPGTWRPPSGGPGPGTWRPPSGGPGPGTWRPPSGGPGPGTWRPPSGGPGPVSADHADALCEAAVTLAERGDAQAIVAVTRGGGTARRLSALRPEAPILATTDRDDTARRLAVYWGVVPVCTDIGENVDAAGALVGRQLVARGLVAAGSTVVLVSISPDLARSDANYLMLHRL